MPGGETVTVEVNFNHLEGDIDLALLGLGATLGTLDEGAWADIVLLDDSLRVLHTFVAGELAYSRPAFKVPNRTRVYEPPCTSTDAVVPFWATTALPSKSAARVSTHFDEGPPRLETT